jgi:hypothetical protein
MPATFAYKKIVCSVLPDSAVSNHVLVLCTVIELYHSGLTASNAFFTVKGGKLITNLPRLHAVLVGRKYYSNVMSIVRVSIKFS